MKSYISNKYKGEVFAPASKSYLQRAIALAILSESEVTMKNVSWCNDTRAAISIAKDFGAKVFENEREVRIKSNQFPNNNLKINCGEAGLGIRMFSPLAALHHQKVEILGEGSLTTRPMNMVEDALKKLNVHVETNYGYLPISVKGPLNGGNIEIDGSLSSQLITGLLISLPKCSSDTLLKVNNPTSKPYIDMTLEILKSFGVEIEHENHELYTIKGNQKYQCSEYNIEGDWSGASFHLVAAAIGGEVLVQNLDVNSQQADKAILKAIESVGAKIEIGENSIRISKNQLKAFNFDARQCPDLFPPLVVLAAACNGISKITGIGRLKHKESDRASVLKNEFQKLGLKIEFKEDNMIIYGNGKLKGGMIHSNNDHRIAMAAAIASLLSSEEVKIENPEAIDKSYPLFYKDFEKLIREN